MSKRVSNTTFTSTGRITGLVRDEAPAGIGQNRTSAPPTATRSTRPPTRRSSTGPA